MVEKTKKDLSPEERILSPYGRLRLKIVNKFSKNKGTKSRHKMVNYAKYGYMFLIPFFVIFFIFQLVPLIQTFYYSFNTYYKDGLDMVGPTFCGWSNYVKMFTDPTIRLGDFFANTAIIWICGFIPQIVVSLLLAIFFTDERLKLKGTKFFQTVTYMPNLVMASAFGMLFLMLFSGVGPVNQLFGTHISFIDDVWWVRGILSFINWLMWFGNTAILLMSGIMGIDESLFESARLDGSSAWHTFWHITMPLLMPIFVYVLITSLIGGIQLFDVAYIFTGGSGGPQMTSNTIMMYLYSLVTNAQDFGLSGAVSVFLFLITAVLSVLVYKTLIPNYSATKAEAKARKKRMNWLKNAYSEGGNENGAD